MDCSTRLPNQAGSPDRKKPEPWFPGAIGRLAVPVADYWQLTVQGLQRP